jgi:phosphoribosyl 1,2-cyclic phosphate phosphodiesterase
MELYPGVPKLNLRNIDVHEMFSIGDLDIMPIRIMHDTMPILGFRIGKLAYITDMKSIDDSELEYLNGVEVLVVNALRWDKPHHSHQLVADAIAFSERIGAEKTYLTHLTHSIGLDKEANRRLPKGVQLGFDGEIIII